MARKTRGGTFEIAAVVRVKVSDTKRVTDDAVRRALVEIGRRIRDDHQGETAVMTGVWPERGVEYMEVIIPADADVTGAEPVPEKPGG